MGLSVSAAAAIVVSSLLVLGIMLYGASNNNVNSVRDALQANYDWQTDRESTEIAIDLFYSYNKSSNELLVDVLNRGETSLNYMDGDVVLNGTLVPSEVTGVNVSGMATDIVHPGELGTLTVNLTDVGLRYDPNISPRLYRTITKNMTSPRNLTVGVDRVYVIDNDDHIDIFTLDGVFKRNFTHDELTRPTDIAVADYANSLYVLDDNDHVDRFYLNNLTWHDQVVDPGEVPDPPLAIAVTYGLAINYLFVVCGDSYVYRFDLDGVYDSRLLPAPPWDPNNEFTELYATNYLYAIESARNPWDVWRLDQTGPVVEAGTEQVAKVLLITGILNSPTDIAVSDCNFSALGKIYIANNSNHIAVFDLDGTTNSIITAGLNNQVHGIDLTAKIYVTDWQNGLVVENLGTYLRVVTENGIMETVLI